MNRIDFYLNLLKEKDEYTYKHSKRVAYYSYLIGKQLNFNKKELLNLSCSALLHDIGKILIPDDILKCKNKLSKKEYEQIKKHVIYSSIILNNSFPELIIDIMFHHERINGTGYFKIKDIPINSQIISIADSFDAMTSNRGYNTIKTFDSAIKELLDDSINYNLYDINLVNAFYLSLNNKIKVKKKTFLY